MAMPALFLFVFLSFTMVASSGVLSAHLTRPTWALEYHLGPLLSGKDAINVYVAFYGNLSSSEIVTVNAFLSSLTPPSGSLRASSLANRGSNAPSVAAWWSVTRTYTDALGHGVSQDVQVLGQTVDRYSMGKHLQKRDLKTLVSSTIANLTSRPTGKFVLVFITAADVHVEGFCRSSCAGHAHIDASTAESVPFVWVGNPKLQCPGLCAWPFAKPSYGPPMAPLVAPNGVAEDGIVMNLARVLVSAATNPFGTAYYEGDDTFAVKDATGACVGVYGQGAYPGFPGKILSNPKTNASYNMEGVDGVQFLVPWIWNAHTKSCEGPAP